MCCTACRRQHPPSTSSSRAVAAVRSSLSSPLFWPGWRGALSRLRKLWKACASSWESAPRHWAAWWVLHFRNTVSALLSSATSVSQAQRSVDVQVPKLLRPPLHSTNLHALAALAEVAGKLLGYHIMQRLVIALMMHRVVHIYLSLMEPDMRYICPPRRHIHPPAFVIHLSACAGSGQPEGRGRPHCCCSLECRPQSLFCRWRRRLLPAPSAGGATPACTS